MDDFFKYLTISEEDLEWGLYLNSVGRLEVVAGTPYPSPYHPAGYFYTWEEGRRLAEFQINYIIEGAGVYENASGQYRIVPGTLMITFPGDWHRYMPLQTTGWTEMYVGFNGALAQKLMSNRQFSASPPVLQIGNRADILDIYLKIIELVKEEQPGFQQIASGLVVKLLGTIVAFEKQKGFTGKPIARIIEEACFLMRKDIRENLDLEAFAERHSISYSYFRRMFRKYTGISPLQYQMQLRIMTARELLAHSGKNVKEISFDLGFESIHYFSRLFKEKVGVPPSEYGKKMERLSAEGDAVHPEI